MVLSHYVNVRCLVWIELKIKFTYVLLHLESKIHKWKKARVYGTGYRVIIISLAVMKLSVEFPCTTSRHMYLLSYLVINKRISDEDIFINLVRNSNTEREAVYKSCIEMLSGIFFCLVVEQWRLHLIHQID